MEDLTTYEFYRDTYCGETIGESAFPKWLSRATARLEHLTCGNITEESRAEYDSRIQNAVCALMDLLCRLEEVERTATARDESNVKSKSSGGESVTFGDAETLVTKVLADKRAQSRLMYDTVAEYLSGTGLLYAGM